MPREERAIILDFLPTGYAERRHPEPIAQALGKGMFTLLEVVPKEGISLKSEEEVYVGEGVREKVKTVKGIVVYDKLTTYARSILPSIVEKIVREDEQRFVQFFNTAGVITPRLHKLELVPGVGKKHLLDLLDARRRKPFESFKDLSERVRLFPDPIKAVVRRIMEELEGKEKYYLFARPPRPPGEERAMARM